MGARAITDHGPVPGVGPGDNHWLNSTLELMTVRRKGFTLVEILIAVILGGLLMGALTLLIANTQDVRSSATSISEVQASASQVEGVLRRELESAGQRMFTGYNFGGLHIRTGESTVGASDTLHALHARTPAMRHSTRPCSSGAPNCLMLVGDWTDLLDEGDLLLSGSPNSGALLLELDDIQGPVVEACGADCAGEGVAMNWTSAGMVMDSVVVSHSLHYPDGRTETRAGGCPVPSTTSEWDSCTENLEERAVGEIMDLSSDTFDGDDWPYTEITFIDRSSAVESLPTSRWNPQSSASGSPVVFSQGINLSTLHIDHENPGGPALVRRLGLDSDGELGTMEPVAYGVRTLEFSAQHRGEPDLLRGLGLEAADLDPDPSNPNYSSSGEFGDRFDRSMLTLSSVRTRFGVEGPREGTRQVGGREEVSMHVATPQLLDGGVFDERVVGDDYSSEARDEYSTSEPGSVAEMTALTCSPSNVMVAELAECTLSFYEGDAVVTAAYFDMADEGVQSVANPSGGATSNVAFSQPGGKFITAWVEDSEGRTSGTLTTYIFVQGDAPEISGTCYPMSIASGDPVACDITHLDGAEPAEWFWDFEGNVETYSGPGTSQSASHPTSGAGPFTIEMWTESSQGVESNRVQITVEVTQSEPLPESFSCTPTVVFDGDPFECTLTIDLPGDDLDARIVLLGSVDGQVGFTDEVATMLFPTTVSVSEYAVVASSGAIIYEDESESDALVAEVTTVPPLELDASCTEGPVDPGEPVQCEITSLVGQEIDEFTFTMDGAGLNETLVEPGPGSSGSVSVTPSDRGTLTVEMTATDVYGQASDPEIATIDVGDPFGVHFAHSGPFTHDLEIYPATVGHLVHPDSEGDEIADIQCDIEPATDGVSVDGMFVDDWLCEVTLDPTVVDDGATFDLIVEATSPGSEEASAVMPTTVAFPPLDLSFLVSSYTHVIGGEDALHRLTADESIDNLSFVNCSITPNTTGVTITSGQDGTGHYCSVSVDQGAPDEATFTLLAEGTSDAGRQDVTTMAYTLEAPTFAIETECTPNSNVGEGEIVTCTATAIGGLSVDSWSLQGQREMVSSAYSSSDATWEVMFRDAGTKTVTAEATGTSAGSATDNADIEVTDKGPPRIGAHTDGCPSDVWFDSPFECVIHDLWAAGETDSPPVREWVVRTIEHSSLWSSEWVELLRSPGDPEGYVEFDHVFDNYGAHIQYGRDGVIQVVGYSEWGTPSADTVRYDWSVEEFGELEVVCPGDVSAEDPFRCTGEFETENATFRDEFTHIYVEIDGVGQWTEIVFEGWSTEPFIWFSSTGQYGYFYADEVIPASAVGRTVEVHLGLRHESGVELHSPNPALVEVKSPWQLLYDPDPPNFNSVQGNFRSWWTYSGGANDRIGFSAMNSPRFVRDVHHALPSSGACPGGGVEAYVGQEGYPSGSYQHIMARDDGLGEYRVTAEWTTVSGDTPHTAWFAYCNSEPGDGVGIGIGASTSPSITNSVYEFSVFRIEFRPN